MKVLFISHRYRRLLSFSIRNDWLSRLANLKSCLLETLDSKFQNESLDQKEWTWRISWEHVILIMESHLREKSRSDSEEEVLAILKVQCNENLESRCKFVSLENTNHLSSWPARWLSDCYLIFLKIGPSTSPRKDFLSDPKKSLSASASCWVSHIRVWSKSTPVPWIAFHRSWLRSFTSRGTIWVFKMRRFEDSDYRIR